MGGQGTLDGDGRRYTIRGALEGEEEGVALGVHDRAAIGHAGGLDQALLVGQDG